LKKITPVAQAASSGGTSKAPTMTSEPRGSLTIAQRSSSNSRRNLSRRAASEPDPRSGPPAMTTRVGSPPVCESMTWILRMAALLMDSSVVSRRRSLASQRPAIGHVSDKR
jgi:hypothetical protein